MIIGLTGYAQSGKDTLAGMLIGLHGYQRIAFADKIREFLYETSPDYIKFLVDEVGWEVAKQNQTVRELLQNTGVGARKVFGEDFWIKEAFKNININHKFVVTDVRFLNEAKAITDLGGQIWRIKRIGVTAVNGHVSETEMDGYPVDQIFTNNGSLQDLKNLIEKRMNDF